VDLRGRFARYYNINHLLSNDCMLICRALIKYGYSNFRLEILEYCDIKELRDRENYYLTLCQPQYNVVKEADNMPSREGYIHREETKAKIQKSQPHRISILVTDIETNTETTYNTMSEADRALGLCPGTISGYFTKGGANP
jgi:hypothetical protein